MDLRAQLMALVADRLAVSNFLQGQALTARGVYKANPVPMPEPVPRPGAEAPAKPKNRGLKAACIAVDPVKALKAGLIK